MADDNNDDILNTPPSIILYGSPGCLAADTFIPCKLAGQQDYTDTTIEELYHRYNQASSEQQTLYALSANQDGFVFDNEVIRVVDSGEKECFEVVTKDGNIYATRDHKFWNGYSYVPLKDLEVDHSVIVLQHRPRATPSTITSITYAGVRHTYDIQMKAPHHNFVANGFVVHNSGKSTEMAKAFPNCLWVVTKKEVLRPYASWLRSNPEEAAKRGLAMIPKERIVEMRPMELMPNGEMRKLDTKKRIKALLNELSIKFKKQPDLSIAGVIFDEWSAFAASILEDIQREVGKNWGAYDELVAFHRELCEWPGLNNKVLGLICHAAEPKYFEKGAKEGQLQYRGGPAIPGGKTIGLVCAAASVVLQLDVSVDEFMPEKPAKRVYRTEVHPLWERKFRDFSAKPEEELGLRELLQRAGFRL